MRGRQFALILIGLLLSFIVPSNTARAQYSMLPAYGFQEGSETPQPLSAEEINDIATQTHGGIATWVGVVSGLDTQSPKLHLIDAERFSKMPTKYGIHQAYSQSMGLVSSANDFIAKMKGKSGNRSLMAYTIYVFKTPITGTDGVKAQWVLQNRRYNFADDESSFTDSLVQSRDLIRRSFPLVTGDPQFITYEIKNTYIRPNRLTIQGRKDISALEDKGFKCLAEEEMILASGEEVRPFIVHNEVENNEAFGFLKLVQTEEDIRSLTPLHIAIFQSLPDRVPPVAAIVTLESQTALSHINVLAINRGTLNIAVRQKNLSLIRQILDDTQGFSETPVRLRVTDSAILVEEASEKEVSYFKKTQQEKVGQLNIPTIDLSAGLKVIKPTNHGPQQIGGKASNYGKIERLLGNSLVLPGYSIGFKLYRDIVTQGGAKAVEKKLITPLLEKVKKGRLTPEEINEQLFEIQAAIKKTKLPDETVRSLYELANGEDYQEFKKIRFRSSTNCEDLPRFNGAGLYLSEGIQTKHLKEVYTSTKSMNKLHEDLLLVLSSLWLPRAFWEREYFSIDHSKAAIAVQINPSFTDEAANGVIIASKKEEVVEYWVNSQFGEASVTNPVRGEVPESIKYSSKSDAESDFNADIQRQRPTLQNASSIGNVFIKNTFGELDEQKIDLFIELLRNTKVLLDNLVEDPRKYGIDIEFKLVNEDQKLKLYLKQARPINLSHTY